MTEQSDFFADTAAAQRRRQFRMTRLQVFNWGTFSDLHDIAMAEDGFLFVGRSGSGKSTLLDAIAVLLVPPQWLTFNAAAREGDRSRRDRNLVSYVRGAWADRTDADSGEIATRFLRTGTTWSALALTFSNGEGRRVTLTQLYWLRGAATGNTDVRRHYMLAERDFDIARDLAGFDMDVRALKRRLDDVDHFGDTFRPYGERFRRLLGIESEMALKLLHKTQSAKNLGDLNTFLREFMLEPPETFAAAERLVAEFAELDAAHQEVVTARRQVETLQPARELHQRMRATEAQIGEHEWLLSGIDSHAEALRADLLSARIDALTARDKGLEGEEQQHTERLAVERERLHGLEAQHRQQGGDRIEALEGEKTRVEAQRDERLRRRDQAAAACRVMGWELPDNAHAFGARVIEARGVAEDWQARQEEADRQRDEIRDTKTALEAEFVEVRREIEAMERQPSNIPAHMLELRHRLVSTLGWSEADLPFVGELLQVKDSEAGWRGATERLLHGFALSLLVDERRYAAVSAFVDETHLGTRLVYYRVGDEHALETGRYSPQSLLHKLELKETTYRPWLEGELARRFDYACVENLRDFRQAKRALTRQGQMRHGLERHEKDDRFAVDDRRRWVLGFDNAEKLALYRQRAGELGARIADEERRLGAWNEDRDRERRRMGACFVLKDLDWQAVDVASVLDRIGTIEAQIRTLREGNRALQDLGERVERQRGTVRQAEDALQKVRIERATLANDLKQKIQEREEALQRAGIGIRPDAALRERLDERFNALGRPTLGNLDERRRQVERAIQAELTALRATVQDCVKRIERAFGHFLTQWPEAGGDLDASIEAASDFMALLQRLEHDGLPRHEQRFFDMLKEQSTENLAALNAHISQARKDIFARMDLVNEGLAQAEFNPGTHLRIDVSDRHLQDVRDFREQVHQILGHAWQMDRAGAEERFLILRQLVHRLAGDEPELRRWREQVLDVRLHVEFIGRELDDSGREVEIYRSGAGKSGGQREKLATTCLAAALRYQLGGADGDPPLYAPVVLDEAFGKADNEFTELAMRIFERFGFQMIVATPLKSVMTLEPFIGGACFVDIAERKRSATLPIEYDTEAQRLRLPAVAHGEELSA